MFSPLADSLAILRRLRPVRHPDRLQVIALIALALMVLAGTWWFYHDVNRLMRSPCAERRGRILKALRAYDMRQLSGVSMEWTETGDYMDLVLPGAGRRLADLVNILDKDYYRCPDAPRGQGAYQTYIDGRTGVISVLCPHDPSHNERADSRRKDAP